MDTRVRIRPSRGFTLLEIMITMTIMGILLAIGLPSMSSFMDTKRLVSATEQVYEHVQQARLEAIARSDKFYVKFNADGSDTWQYGISLNGDCDLSKTDRTDSAACVTIINDGDATVHGVNGTDTGDMVLTRFTDADYEGVSMAVALSGGVSKITFDPLRGTAQGDGSITLTSAGGKTLKVKVGPLGQLRICSSDGSVPGYSTASC